MVLDTEVHLFLEQMVAVPRHGRGNGSEPHGIVGPCPSPEKRASLASGLWRQERLFLGPRPAETLCVPPVQTSKESLRGAPAHPHETLVLPELGLGQRSHCPSPSELTPATPHLTPVTNNTGVSGTGPLVRRVSLINTTQYYKCVFPALQNFSITFSLASFIVKIWRIIHETQRDTCESPTWVIGRFLVNSEPSGGSSRESRLIPRFSAGGGGVLGSLRVPPCIPLRVPPCGPLVAGYVFTAQGIR